MAKKLVIPKETFGGMSIYDPHYQIRYRLVSEDRNRVSAWSPIYSVDPEVIFTAGTREIRGNLRLLKQTGYVSASWDAVTLYKQRGDLIWVIGKLPYYDVWIQWTDTGGASPSEWIYSGSIASTSLNIVVPATYPYNSSNIVPKQLNIEIYRPGIPVARYQTTKSFPQDSGTIDITNDTIRVVGGHNFSTGTAVVYNSATPITGLTNGATYYLRVTDYDKFALYDTYDHSRNTFSFTGRMNLNGTPSGTGSITGKQFLMYSGTITPL